MQEITTLNKVENCKAMYEQLLDNIKISGSNNIMLSALVLQSLVQIQQELQNSEEELNRLESIEEVTLEQSNTKKKTN